MQSCRRALKYGVDHFAFAHGFFRYFYTVFIFDKGVSFVSCLFDFVFGIFHGCEASRVGSRNREFIVCIVCAANRAEPFLRSHFVICDGRSLADIFGRGVRADRIIALSDSATRAKQQRGADQYDTDARTCRMRVVSDASQSSSPFALFHVKHSRSEVERKLRFEEGNGLNSGAHC